MHFNVNLTLIIIASSHFLLYHLYYHTGTFFNPVSMLLKFLIMHFLSSLSIPLSCTPAHDTHTAIEYFEGSGGGGGGGSLAVIHQGLSGDAENGEEWECVAVRVSHNQ